MPINNPVVANSLANCKPPASAVCINDLCSVLNNAISSTVLRWDITVIEG